MVKPIKIYVFSLLCWCVPALAAALPEDVSRFIEARQACDHWRGEYGYDKARQAEIDQAVCQTCVGTDTKLATLRAKYKNRQEIIKQLDEFEPDLEPADTSATAAFCKRVGSK